MSLTRMRVLMAAFAVGGGAWLYNPAVGELDEPSAREKNQALTDRHGDPLPAGAVMRLGTVRFRAPGGGSGLAFLPDGKSLVTTSEDGKTFQFWETTTGRLLREISTGTQDILGMALSPDGKMVAAAGHLPDEGKGPTGFVIRILDVVTGKELQSFQRGNVIMDYCELAFTPDCKLLVSFSGTRDSGVRIEEIASGVELRRQPFPGDFSAQLALSPDGATIAVASGPNLSKAYLWRWQSDRGPQELSSFPYGLGSLCFSADGKMLAGRANHPADLRLWEVATGQVRLTWSFPTGAGSGGRLAFTPDGKVLAAADWGDSTIKDLAGGVYLWDLGSAKLRHTLATPGEGIAAVAVSPDGHWLAGAAGTCLHIWDLRTGQEVAADPESHHGGLNQIVCVRGLIATASGDATMRVWDAASGRQRFVLPQGQAFAAALSPDGAWVASSGLDDAVHLWDARTGQEIYKLAGHGKMGGRRAVSFTPDSRRLLSWGDDFYLRVWDLKTGKALLEHALRPAGVRIPGADAEPDDLFRHFPQGGGAFSGDGRIFVMGMGHMAHVFDVATGNEIGIIEPGCRQLIAIAVSADGKHLLATGWGREIAIPGAAAMSMADEHQLALWDLATGKLLRHVDLPGRMFGPLAFSADGKLYASTTSKPADSIRVWDTATGEERFVLTGFRGRISALAFTPDGKRIISGMNDASALVWDLASKRIALP